MNGPLTLLLIFACAACAVTAYLLLEGVADDWQARHADARSCDRFEATRRALRAGTKKGR